MAGAQVKNDDIDVVEAQLIQAIKDYLEKGEKEE